MSKMLVTNFQKSSSTVAVRPYSFL